MTLAREKHDSLHNGSAISKEKPPDVARSRGWFEIMPRGGLARPPQSLASIKDALAKSSAKTMAHWDIAEELVLAAAEAREWETCEQTLAKISARFPVSWRADVLKGRVFEARGDWDAAMTVYINVVKRDPVKAAPAYKRQIAVLKTRRKDDEAIALLNYYLSVFGTDYEAWAELSALCLARGRFSHGLFAANELVILQPTNFEAHLIVGDVYLTVGGHENELAARRQYAASLSIQRVNNMRALYGMWTAASRLKGGDKWVDSTDLNEVGENESVDDQRMGNEQVINWARDAIFAVYKSQQGSGADLNKLNLSIVVEALKPCD
jgi:hypothetical protein